MGSSLSEVQKVTAAPSFLSQLMSLLCTHYTLLWYNLFNRPPHMGYGSSPRIPCKQTFSSTVFVCVKEKRWINRVTGPWLFLKDVVFLTRRASANFPVVLICKSCWLVSNPANVNLVLFRSYLQCWDEFRFLYSPISCGDHFAQTLQQILSDTPQ